MPPTTVAIDGKVLLPTGVGAPGGEVRTLLTVAGSVDDGGTEQLINGFSINPIGPDGTVDFSLVPNDIISTVGPNYYRAAIRTQDKPDGMPIEWILFWSLLTSDGPTVNIGDILVAAVFPANPLAAPPPAATLEGLADTNVPTPLEGDVLTRTSGIWVASPPALALPTVFASFGALPAPDVNQHRKRAPAFKVLQSPGNGSLGE